MRGSERAGRGSGDSSARRHATRPRGTSSTPRPPWSQGSSRRGSAAAHPTELWSAQRSMAERSTWNAPIPDDRFHVKPRRPGPRGPLTDHRRSEERVRTTAAGTRSGQGSTSVKRARGGRQRPPSSRASPSSASGLARPPRPACGRAARSPRSCPPSRSSGARTLGDRRRRCRRPGPPRRRRRPRRAGSRPTSSARPTHHLDPIGQAQPADGPARGGRSGARWRRAAPTSRPATSSTASTRPGTPPPLPRSSIRRAGRRRRRSRGRARGVLDRGDPSRRAGQDPPGPGASGWPSRCAARRLHGECWSGIRRQDDHPAEGLLALRAGGHARSARSPRRGRPCGRPPTSARGPAARRELTTSATTCSVKRLRASRRRSR